MKYLVTKSQLLEATKFPKGNVVPDKYCPMVERLIMDYNEGYSHYVLISYNGYSVSGKNGTSEKIENLIEGFLPIKTFVVVMDNDGGCDDDSDL